MKKISLPKNQLFEKAYNIIIKLVNNGYKAYYVGGCVRDIILGKEPKEIDIATDAKPEVVQNLFKRTLAIGKAFGVIVVLLQKDQFEVATFRKDGEYNDGRRPKSVEFTDEKEDVYRRDFTINGLLYDPIKNEVLDYVNGVEDIEKGVIRCIGDPYKRFDEDKLRILRCIRFATRFGFEIEKETYNALFKFVPKINEISVERIGDELSKILEGPNSVKAIRELDKCGILNIVLPEVSALKGVEQPKEFHPEGDVFEHTMIMLELSKKRTFDFALAILFHDIGKPACYEVTDRIRFSSHEYVGAKMATQICNRLKLSNIVSKKIYDLVLNHMRFKDVKNMKESTLKRFFRMDHFEDHLELHRIDCLASHGSLENYNYCIEKINEFKNQKKELKPKLLLNGRDLIELGFKPGPDFSKILKELEDQQLEEKILTKAAAVDWIKSNFSDLL